MNCAAKLVEFLINRVVLGGDGGSDRTWLEVERKFRLTAEEFDSLPALLLSLGFQADSQVDMTDTFLPTAFAGDMMRVRRQSGMGTVLTRKCWIATPDGGKERKETEREIAGLTGLVILAAGRVAKGSRLLSLSKHRQMFVGRLGGRQTVVSLDRVDRLGANSGCYMEIEILVPPAEDVTAARQQIAGLASKLLGDQRAPVALSYMEMLKQAVHKQ